MAQSHIAPNLNQPLLFDCRRSAAAAALSISIRSLDYLIASGVVKVRRIGSRILIPLAEFHRMAGVDHVGSVIG